MAPTVVLVGPPGAGKTTVGRLLAARLGLAFRDTDDDVESAAGMPVTEIFVDLGEEQFRRLEAVAVARALAEHPGVLALGGGAILDPATVDLLAGHRVVFLDVQIKDAAPRVGFNRDRPLLLGNPRAQWVRLMAARRDRYEQVASATVETGGLTADAVARRVVAVLDGLQVGPGTGPGSAR
jgi:shikimate kinase